MIDKNEIPNLQQIPKTETSPMGKFFFNLKEKFKDTPIRFIRTDFTPQNINSHDDEIFTRTHMDGLDFSLQFRCAKNSKNSMFNVLIESKRHNKRKGSEAYHNRIQKKWDKRVLAEGSDCKLAVQVSVQVTMPKSFSKFRLVES